MSKALVLGAAALVFSAAGALAADLVAPGYGYVAPPYAAPAPVYATPPIAPIYTPPTVIYVEPPVHPAPQLYAGPPMTTGYYAQHPVRQSRYRGRYMITRLDLGMSTPHPDIGIEAIGAAVTDSSGAKESRQTRLLGLRFLSNAHVVA